MLLNRLMFGQIPADDPATFCKRGCQVGFTPVIGRYGRRKDLVTFG
jgi:hypothetical protein